MISPIAAIVDALLAEIGRQRDRRLIERLAADHEVAAGEVLRQAAQVHAGEDDLRAGRSDIDSDREQRHVVLQPEAGRRRVVLAADVVVIVIVVGFAVLVRVRGVDAEEVILQAVRALLLRGLGHGCRYGNAAGSGQWAAKAGPYGTKCHMRAG